MVSETAKFHATIPPRRKRAKRNERNRLWWAVWVLIAASFLLPAIAFAAERIPLLLI